MRTPGQEWVNAGLRARAYPDKVSPLAYGAHVASAGNDPLSKGMHPERTAAGSPTDWPEATPYSSLMSPKAQENYRKWQGDK